MMNNDLFTQLMQRKMGAQPQGGPAPAPPPPQGMPSMGGAMAGGNPMMKPQPMPPDMGGAPAIPIDGGDPMMQTSGSMGAPPPPQGAMPPMGVPPNAHPHMPSEGQRWSNGQQIQKAYANNWQPNPMLLQAMLGRA